MKTTKATTVPTSHKNREARKSARRTILATSVSALLPLLGIGLGTSAFAVNETFTLAPALAVPDANPAGLASVLTPA